MLAHLLRSRRLAVSLLAVGGASVVQAGCQERKSAPAAATTESAQAKVDLPLGSASAALAADRLLSSAVASAVATDAAVEQPPAQPTSIPAPPDVAAAPANASKTASGLASRVLQKGKGATHPTAADTVTVHYTGWKADGTMFDSSVARKEPTSFPLANVIKGWTEGVQLMVEGEKRRFWIPSALAYGDRPSMAGTPTGPLVFDVELLDIKRPPVAPSDVKAAPATAKKTASGLAYRSLKPGTGTVHPTSASEVVVNYTGWTTDGAMFDSSETHGGPATFPLANVIKGWTEGVQLMVVGEKMRFWIPGKLAYGDGPPGGGTPRGLLVFDVELVAIK
jgi:FKBP-type peptidyl-prolyl cis-trans isomerase